MIATQRCWYITLRDCGLSGFQAEAAYADTTADQSLIMEIERKTLVIKNAVLEVRRGLPGIPASAPVPALAGITAYFGSGKQLRQALAETPAILDMAAQALTAVIQAEAFFYQDRGFASAAAYDDFWDEIAKDSCVYYSNLDRVDRRFADYIENQRRGKNLFHRYMLTALEETSAQETSGQEFAIRGHLLDSYHEMGLTLQLDPGFQISNASAAMLRCPDPVCREALERVNSLKGMPLTTDDLKRYQKTCGGAAGCTHIEQLVKEAAYTLDIYKNMK